MSMSSSFVLGHSFVIRHSCFVIFTLLTRTSEGDTGVTFKT